MKAEITKITPSVVNIVYLSKPPLVYYWVNRQPHPSHKNALFNFIKSERHGTCPEEKIPITQPQNGLQLQAFYQYQ
jgi:hypothetical protein